VESIKVGSPPPTAGGWLSEVPSLPVRNSLAAYGLGNGVGLDLTEEPFLGRDRGVEIRPGMVLTLRICLAGSECGTALISQPFRVTENGLQSLVKPVDDLVLAEG